MALSRRTIAISIIVLVLVALGSGVYLRLSGGGDGASTETTSSRGDPAETSAGGAFATDIAVPVEGAAVIRDTLVISVNAAAQAAAEKRATLRAQVEGRIQRIRVAENQATGEGQILLEIDPTQYQLELERAEAQLATAQATFNELTLFDENLTDSTVRAERARVASAKSGLDAARVGLREAQLRLARATVRAPFGGRVANLRVVPGQWVSAGDELVTIVDIDPVKVEVQVLESEVGLLATGRGATVTFAAFPGQRFQGRIATINPMVDETSRTARVTVTIANPDARILPGMYARVALEARKFPNRVLVPRSAILERDRRTMLFVFEGEGAVGLSKWRYVTTGLANDSLIEILQNPETDMVRPGEIVLTDGHYTLIHDANVRLVEDVRASGGRPR